MTLEERLANIRALVEKPTDRSYVVMLDGVRQEIALDRETILALIDVAEAAAEYEAAQRRSANNPEYWMRKARALSVALAALGKGRQNASAALCVPSADAKIGTMHLLERAVPPDPVRQVTAEWRGAGLWDVALAGMVNVSAKELARSGWRYVCPVEKGSS
jgi:hypothetical protein